MKRIELYLLGAAIALCLAGCGSNAEGPSRPPESSRPPEQSHILPPSEPAPSPSALPSEPALSPTPAPAPTPAEEEGDYFDGALFVGDSIMESIRQYVAAQRKEGEMLGTAQFLTSTMGVALADLVGDRDWGMSFSYRGEERPLEDIVAEIAPRRVFLLLGLNDLASDTDPAAAEIAGQYRRLISSLQAACPGTEFIVITNPPKVASRWLPDYTANRNFGNELIGEFVAELTRMCREQGIPYVDAYQCLKDENGALPDEYCRDGFIHLSHQGAAVVVDALNAFAEGR